MKNIIRIISNLVATALIAIIVFTGYGAGMKEKLMKIYNYCRYQITAQEEKEVISPDGELMNIAQNNWVISHEKGEIIKITKG